MTPPDPFGLVGQVLDGQFRVDHPVGEGGFSVVYRGTHVGLSEPIAVKCLKLPAALGSALVDSFVRRFRDESRLQYKLSQGNLHIVRSLGSGTTLAPATSALVPYTVLEWLEGRSLAQEFTERREAGQHGRSMREVVALLDSAIDALAYAHAQGVVHRDLNPGNLFLARTSSGIKLKILDFGVAKVLSDAAIAIGPTARTVGNVKMFAPAYGAPEQFDDRAGAVGPWTDVYAIALVVLEALADRTVMEGEHLGEFAMKALDGAHRPSPRGLGIAVGDATEKVFVNALALDPSRRPRDAGEFLGHAQERAAGRRALQPAGARRGGQPRDAPHEAERRLALAGEYAAHGALEPAFGERAPRGHAAAVGRREAGAEPGWAVGDDTPPEALAVPHGDHAAAAVLCVGPFVDVGAALAVLRGRPALAPFRVTARRVASARRRPGAARPRALAPRARLRRRRGLVLLALGVARDLARTHEAS